MSDVTISEYADALRRELSAEMRVHRTEVEGALRDVKTQLRDSRREGREQHREVVDAIAELTATVNGQATTVNELATARATWARRAQIIAKAATSTPGLITTLTTLAGAAAAAIALL